MLSSLFRSINTDQRNLGDAVKSRGNNSLTFKMRFRSSVEAQGALVFVLRTLRLVSCLALAALSLVSTLKHGALLPEDAIQPGPSRSVSPSISLDLAHTVFYVSIRCSASLRGRELISILQAYTSFLSALLLVLVPAKRRQISRQVTILSVSLFVIYVWRDLYPFCTYELSPADDMHDWLLRSRIILLSFTAVLMPLISPREYFPLDPEV